MPQDLPSLTDFLAEPIAKSGYGEYLKALVAHKI